MSFEEAATAFADRLSVTVPDPDHSDVREARYILVGQSERARLLAVSHAERGTAIRNISARPASRREREQYEEGEQWGEGAGPSCAKTRCGARRDARRVRLN